MNIYESIIEATTLGYWECNTRLGVDVVHPLLLQQLGYSATDIIGTDWQKQLLEPEGQLLLQNALLHKNITPFILHFRHAQGNSLPLLATVRIIEYNNNQPEHWIVIFTPSQQQQPTSAQPSEMPIAKPVTPISELLTFIADIVFILDNKGDFLEVYTRKKDILLETEYNIIGRHFAEILPPDIAEQYHYQLQLAKKNAVPHSFSYTLNIHNVVRTFRASISANDERSLVLVYDITEQLHTEELLQKNSRRYQSILTAQSNYIIRTDMQGFYTFANEHFTDTFVPPGATIIGTNSMESIYHEDHGICFETVRDCLKNPGKPITCVLRKPHYRTNTLRYSRWEFVAILNEYGVPEEIQCVGADITDELEKEQDYQQRGRLLHAFSTTFNHVLFQAKILENGHLLFLFVSERIREICRLQPDKILQNWQPFFSMVHVQDRDSLLTTLQHAYKNTEPWRIELRLNIRFVGQRWVELQAAPEPTPDGTILWYGSIADITNDVVTRSRERLLAYVAEYAGSLVIITDEERRIQWVNKEFTNLTGYTVEEAIGKSPGSLLQGPATDPETIHQLRRTLRNNEGFVGDIYNYRKDRTGYWISANIQPVRNEQGVVTNFIGLQTYIDDQKRLLQRLQESERHYRMLVENTSDGIAVLDATGSLVYASPVYRQMFGYDENEKIDIGPDEIFELLHPEDRNNIFTDIYAAIQQKKTHLSYVYRARRPNTNSEYYWREDHSHFIYDKAGNLLETFVVARDITERKKIEQQTEFKNTLLKAVLNTTAVSHCVIDSNFKILFLDKKVQNITHAAWGLEAKIGDSILQYASADYRAILQQDIKTAYGGKTFVRLQKVEAHGLALGWWENTFTPLYNSNGDQYGVLIMSLDVTQRESQNRLLQEWNSRLEEEVESRTKALNEQIEATTKLLETVKEKENLLSQIASTSPDVIFLYDMEKKEDIFSTKHIFELLGYNSNLAYEENAELEESVKEKYRAMLLAEPNQPPLFSHDKIEQLKDGEFMESEQRFRHADGSIKIMRARVCVFERTTKGEAKIIYGIINDITQQRNIEEELRQNALSLQQANSQLERINNEKSEIMGLVAHDLKNLIGSLILSSDLLAKYYSSMSPEKIQSVVDRIVKSALQMRSFVSQMLNAEAIEEKGLHPNFQPCDVGSILKDTIVEYREAAVVKNITLDLPEDFSLCGSVLCDRQMLYHILDNLISNAVKYSLHETTISIRCQQEHQFLTVAISDGGPGIVPDDMDKLFRRYQRLTAKPTGGESSTGLGLAIVKKMVEANNGSVWCESSPPNGATFYVQLPLVPVEKATNS